LLLENPLHKIEEIGHEISSQDDPQNTGIPVCSQFLRQWLVHYPVSSTGAELTIGEPFKGKHTKDEKAIKKRERKKEAAKREKEKKLNENLWLKREKEKKLTEDLWLKKEREKKEKRKKQSGMQKKKENGHKVKRLAKRTP